MRFFVVVFFITFLPFVARASVMVTEIAWMGTANSANDEWIELYNDGGGSVNLSGWTLSASDGTPSINLSGTIGAGAYALLERTDDTSYPGITALMTFTGALGNTGENLTLKNGSTVIQSMDYASGWPAGDATTKQTMQWTGSSWVTANETAGSATVASGGDDDNGDNTGDDDTTTGDDDTTTGDDDATADDDNGGDTTISKTSTATMVKKVFPEMLLKIVAPTKIIANNPAYFSGEALDYDRSNLIRGKYIWNMGDGSTRTFTQDFNYDLTKGFYHTYEHTGTYLVTLKYYKTVFDEGVSPDLQQSFNVEVIAPTVIVSKVYPDKAIELKNSSSTEVDVSKWFMVDANGFRFYVPDDTKILAGKSSVFTYKTTRLNPENGVSLLTPTGVIVSSVGMPIEKVVTNNSTVSVYKKPSTKVEISPNEGEVLGAETSANQDLSVEEKTKIKNHNGLLFILAFVILILIAVIAALLMQKEKQSSSEEEYKLIDE